MLLGIRQFYLELVKNNTFDSWPLAQIAIQPFLESIESHQYFNYARAKIMGRAMYSNNARVSIFVQ